MKKTATTLAALTLALGLGACSVLDVEEPEPTEKVSASKDKPKNKDEEKAGNLADNLPNSVDDFTAKDREYLVTIETIAEGDDLPNKDLVNFRDDAIDEQQVLTVQFGRELADATVAIPEEDRTQESYINAINEAAEANGYPEYDGSGNSTVVKATAVEVVYTPGYFETIKDFG